jgi:hypothetical protein
MKCKIKDCQEQANPPFEACDTTHGVMLKAARHSLQLMMSAKLRADGLMQWRHYFYGQPTIDDAIYYSNL